MPEIILASQSPRRKQLLQWAELDFLVMVSDTDESFPPELRPDSAAVHIARQKALAIQEKEKDKTIIAADTIVVLNGEIIGKPRDREEAIEFLSRLSGHHHQVITGVVIVKKGKGNFFCRYY